MSHPTLLDLLLGRVPGGGGGAARDALAACLDCEPWVRAVLAGVPHPDVEQLLEVADAAVRALPPAVVLAALRTCPPLGEPPTGDGPAARMARLEQAGLADDPASRQELAVGVADYEQRFGHPFVLRAAGLGTGEVLAALHRRLAHDPAVELAVAADQLRQVALLRLEASLVAPVGHVAEPADERASAG